LLKHKLSFLTLLAPFFLLLNCAGIQELFNGNFGSGNAGSSGQQAAEHQAVGVSIQQQQNNGHWICGVQDGQLIIIGVSGRLSRPNDEIEAAKQDAAAKAAMYHGIQGSVTAVGRSGSNIMEYTSDTVINLNYDTDLTQYLNRLTFDPEKDVIRTSSVSGSPGAVFVRMKYSAPVPVNVNYNSTMRDGSPTWVNNRDLPVIPGYAVVVGVSGRKSQLKDTILSSLHAAAARLIETTSTQMMTEDKTGSSAGSSSTMYSVSEGRLSNFHALEFWIADNGSVYTLAIARVAQ